MNQITNNKKSDCKKQKLIFKYFNSGQFSLTILQKLLHGIFNIAFLILNWENLNINSIFDLNLFIPHHKYVLLNILLMIWHHCSINRLINYLLLNNPKSKCHQRYAGDRHIELVTVKLKKIRVLWIQIKSINIVLLYNLTYIKTQINVSIYD